MALRQAEGGPRYDKVLSGEITGAAAATQLPNIPCAMVRFKASSTNVGKVYLGTSAAVTVAQNTTNATTGLQMVAGDDTGWIFATNLNLFWNISTNVADCLTYLALD